ncbi:hypothetical protein GIY09_11370 [Aerococcaceae bacterium WS4759]|uniref:DUF2178 domain-containing protein n=1 Tax=Fundicoccus ignavus TaxID=2664442 RepID=A0A6I2GSL0_9LACT|nr:hypothetical protein [Fundicoccus ignavus]MRI86445.1 hypothetical protein [Fundicoccus ignavus]
MDWIVWLFLIILAVCIFLIAVTLLSLPKLGDERANFIKTKAQSYAFGVVIVLLILEVLESIYLTIWSESSYSGLNPLTFLVSISVIYLISLLLFKKKYDA